MAPRNEDDSYPSEQPARGPRSPRQRQALSQELFHGLTPEEFNQEAKELAKLEALTPQVRARMKAQLTERLKTPVDQPSWGPDWVRHGERVSASAQKKRGFFKKIFGRFAFRLRCQFGSEIIFQISCQQKSAARIHFVAAP